MKLTIILSDGAVYKDGVSYHGLDLSGAPDNIHALQWNGESGWIEFVNESEFRKPANENIDTLPDWANDALAKWSEAKSAYTAAQAAMEEEAAQNQPTVDGAEIL